jgi:DNA-binding transcriptional ArsR family regulator
MKVKIITSPFGTTARTSVLLALKLLDESYARELARLLDLPLSGVQRALRSLESDGLIAARSAGRTRLFRLDPRYFARAELAAFLSRLSEAQRGLRGRVEALRRRPRRSGKPL